MRPFIATCLILALAFAGAWTMPSDAQVVLTAEDGTIVGVGQAYGGTHFELELLAGFEGPARLLIVQLAGDPLLFDAVVRDDIVFVDASSVPDRFTSLDPADLVDLAHVLEASGFVTLAIGARDPGAAGRATAAGAREAAPADPRSGTDDAGGPDERADDRAREALDGAGNAADRAVEGGGNAADRALDDERPERPAGGRP